VSFYFPFSNLIINCFLKCQKEEKRKRGILDDGAHGPTHPPILPRKNFGSGEALMISRGLRHPEFLFSSFPLFLFLTL
jgi:hypothetical protein